jgi:hypothetical protein
MRVCLTALAVAAVCLCCSACRSISDREPDGLAVVGTWLVKISEAPFPYHMFVFHSDGTMQQSNPDAGDPNTSDSNGMGVWVAAADRIGGKFVEVTADRTTRRFVSRGEISFSIQSDGQCFRRHCERGLLRCRGTTIKRAAHGDAGRSTRYPVTVWPN